MAYSRLGEDAMTLRDYQTRALSAVREGLAAKRSTVLVCPTGGGKTIMGASAAAGHLKRNDGHSVLWLAHRRELVDQAVRTIRELSGESVRTIVAGQSSGEGRVTVASIDTVRNWADLPPATMVVIDECHHAHAPGWFDQISTCAGARWGFSATPGFEGDLADWKRQRLTALFGDDWLELEGRTGRLVRAKVVLCDPPWLEGLAERIEAETERLFRARRRFWGGDPQQLRAQVWWQKCVELGICGNPARTEQVVALARLHHRLGDSVLVLVPLVDYARQVAEAVGDGAMACYSGMGAKARRLALHCFKHGEVRCLVATSLADEGLDVPRANVLVLASGGRNRAKAEQRTGRVLRAFAGKERGLIYDFKDSAHKLMAKHARRRADLFRELGYEVVDSAGGVV